MFSVFAFLILLPQYFVTFFFTLSFVTQEPSTTYPYAGLAFQVRRQDTYLHKYLGLLASFHKYPLLDANFPEYLQNNLLVDQANMFGFAGKENTTVYSTWAWLELGRNHDKIG